MRKEHTSLVESLWKDKEDRSIFVC